MTLGEQARHFETTEQLHKKAKKMVKIGVAMMSTTAGLALLEAVLNSPVWVSVALGALAVQAKSVSVNINTERRLRQQVTK